MQAIQYEVLICWNSDICEIRQQALHNQVRTVQRMEPLAAFLFIFFSTF